MNNFDKALALVLKEEGGYSNHPKDPGGATMHGVTQRVYDTYRKRKGLPVQSVKFISPAEEGDIYKAEYWDKVQGDELPPGVSYVVFDGAVNSGVGQSVKWLQRSLQALGLYSGKIDGIMGQGTLQAVASVNDNDTLIDRIIERRAAFLRSLKTWKTFGKGWQSRIDRVKKIGQAWETGSTEPESVYVVGGDAKAVLADAKSAPNVGAADATTGAGGGSLGVAALVKGAQEQLQPLTGTSQFIDQAVAGLIVLGLVVGIGGYAWRVYSAKKRAALVDALDLTPGAAP